MLKIAKLLGPLPGISLAALPVGLIAWDEEGNFYEEWVPDVESTAFWRGVIAQCKEQEIPNPDILEFLGNELVNGITTDLTVYELPVPSEQTAAEFFADLAVDLQMEWATISEEVQQSVQEMYDAQNRLAEQAVES